MVSNKPLPSSQHTPTNQTCFSMKSLYRHKRSGDIFAIESGEQSPPQKRNEGVSRLVICLPETKGRITIAILLSPQWEDGISIKKVAVKPLEKW